MATLPLFISFGPFSLVVSRYNDLSSTAICCSVVSALTPASELKSAFVLSEFRMLPPASQSIGSQCHTVSSLPSAGISQPYWSLAGSVSFLAAARKSSHVQFGVGGSTPASAKSFLL